MGTQNGLLFALLLDGQGGAKELGWEQVNHWQPSQGELWLHLDYSAFEVQDWLFTKSQLDIAVADTLLSSESRPRFSAMESGVLMAWRGANMTQGAEPADMVALRLWHEAGRLITTARREVASIDELKSQLLNHKGAYSLPALLVDLADRMVWRIGEVVGDYEEQIGELEDLVIESTGAQLRTQLSSLRRQVIGLRRYVAPQKEALLRFSTEKLDWLESNDRMELREVVDRITRELEDLEALRERAMVAQEELQNRLSEQLNNRMYILSIITAVFLPLGFLTGMFGINIGGMPGVENPDAFRYFAWSIVVLIIVQLVVFKWRKWF